MNALNPAVIKLIIILLIAGSGFIRWVIVKLQEQAAKKRALEQVARRRDEALRTGRNLDEGGLPDPATERARLEAEAAARRQAQIDEFRRRQQERARARAESQRGPAAAPVPAASPAPPVIRPTPRQEPSPRVALPSTAAPGAAKRGPRRLLTPSSPEPETTHALVARPEQQPAAAQAARAALARPRTPEHWRRAIVMNALLAPAPGLGEGSDPWSPVS